MFQRWSHRYGANSVLVVLESDQGNHWHQLCLQQIRVRGYEKQDVAGQDNLHSDAVLVVGIGHLQD